jgi:DNA-binding NarL/FixJ family response regulator
MVARERELLEEPRSVRRILIVDDHSGFRRCARELLTAEGFEVVGEAADGDAALAMIAASAADVVLLDIQLPGANGFEVAERLLAVRRDLPVILISTRDRSVYGDLVDASGARGFVSKDELSGEAVRELLR